MRQVSKQMSSTDMKTGNVGNEPSQPRQTNGLTRLIIYEALFVGSFNMLNSWFVAWIIFHRRTEIPVWGPSGMVFNSFPSSFVPAFLIAIIGTLALRRGFTTLRRRAPAPPSNWMMITKLPAVLWKRALVIAAGSAIVTVLVTILWVVATGVASFDFTGFMYTQMVQAGILGVIVGPIVGARVLFEPGVYLPGRP